MGCALHDGRTAGIQFVWDKRIMRSGEESFEKDTLTEYCGEVVWKWLQFLKCAGYRKFLGVIDFCWKERRGVWMGRQNDAFVGYLNRDEILADLYNGCLYSIHRNGIARCRLFCASAANSTIIFRFENILIASRSLCFLSPFLP